MPQQYSGYATTFADPGDLKRYQDAIARGASEQQALSVGDNGIGAPALGSVSTPGVYGVAVPTSYLRQNLGNDPAAWRRARALITYGDTSVQVPIVDVGPGQKQLKRGVITDLTDPLSRALGTSGKDKVGMTLLPDAGPDYSTHGINWQNEQDTIADRLASQAQGSMMADNPAGGEQEALQEGIRGMQIRDDLLQGSFA